MDRKTNVMHKEVVQVGAKTNIVDKGLNVFYNPTFYNKQQAYDILQQLNREVVNESTECSSFIPAAQSLNSSANQFGTGDEGSTGSKKSMNNGPCNPILMKIRDDIEEALGIRLNLCLADWHKDGHGRKGVTMHNEEDMDTGSSVIWMSFGDPSDLLLRYIPNTLSNEEKPKFSIYKFNLPSGSLIQMKPPINNC